MIRKTRKRQASQASDGSTGSADPSARGPRIAARQNDHMRSSVPCGCRTQLDAEPTLLHVTVSLRDEPETVAERIRALLNISFEEQRSWQDQYAAAVHVESASPVKQD